MKKQKVIPILFDTYIAVIKNSVGSKIFRNSYAKINNKKTDLLSFLRKELNNFQISLILTVKQIISEARPYTTKEKFNSMIEKNAYLLKLKEQLDLDIDY